MVLGMGTRRIVWMVGDTPGAELIEAARSVFDALGVAPVEHERGRIGWHEWLETGESVAPEPGVVSIAVEYPKDTSCQPVSL